MATAPGFDAVMTATEERCSVSGPPIDAPVTVAFGSRDRVLLARHSRHVDQLPPGTRVKSLPGCGHVPMADDPGAVTAFIVAAAGVSSAPGSDGSQQPETSVDRSR
jgi:pimeloyl-ACP methyl ester carboxylesterase